MKRWLPCIGALALVVATGATSDRDSWLQVRYAEALAMASGWNVKGTVFRTVDSDYVVVGTDGVVSFGAKLSTRLQTSPGNNQLAEFILLHELRHVHQIRGRMNEGSIYRECDSDFYATYQLATQMLSRMPPDDNIGDAIYNVLSMQALGPRTGNLASEVSDHDHLLPAQRVAIGAYAAWRALHHWFLTDRRASNKSLAKLRKSALGFVEPSDKNLGEWVDGFCTTLNNRQSMASRSISITPVDSELDFDEIVEGDDSLNFGFATEDTYEIRNNGDQAVKIIAYPLFGYHDSGAKEDYESYFVTSGAYISADVGPDEEKLVKLRVERPLSPPADVTYFGWTSPVFPGLVVSTTPVGPKREVPNCMMNWVNPDDGDLDELFSFMLRAGQSVNNEFGSLRGDDLRVGSRTDALTLYEWRSLPALVMKDGSIISQLSGAYSGKLSIAQAGDLNDADALYMRLVQALRSSCQVPDVEFNESGSGRGQKTFSVRFLTMFSVASVRLYPNEVNAGEAQTFSVDIDIQAK